MRLCALIFRWWFAMSVLVLLVLLAGWPAGAAEPPAGRPNVLLVMCDDLRPALHCYGDTTASSPNIDALAARGVRFSKAYCQFPLCNPSRASLLTGRRPGHTQVRNNGRHFRAVAPDVVTLPQAFRQAGYRVERVGKLYHYGVPAQIGTDGLDDPPSWDAVFNPRGRDVTDEPLIFSLEPGKFGGTVSWLAAEGSDAEQTDGIGAARAVELLEGFAETQKPFFLAVGFYRPHTPYVAPRSWFAQHPPEQIELPQLPADHDAQLPAAALQMRDKKEQRLVGPLGREAVQAYRAAVSFVDAQVGSVVAALRRLKLDDNTIIVFTSDHGYHLGEHGLWQKRTLFEESARVPLVIVPPPGSAPAGVGTVGVVDHPVELIDILPTVCSLAGVPTPAGIDGRSLVADMLAACGVADVKLATRPALTEVEYPGLRGVSMRTERHRYTLWNGGRLGRQLYDHDTDPHEFHNLADKPEQAATVAQLDRQLRELYGTDLSAPPREKPDTPAPSGSTPTPAKAAALPAATRPNVLVILADDLGYSDLGCYGGEIDTPHLDALAAGGLRFTQGYNTARCWPSRAALLTGFYPQAVGRDALPAAGSLPALAGGGGGRRPPWAKLLPELLTSAGYRSYHSGKWHIDGAALEQGFCRSLAVNGTGENNFFDPTGVDDPTGPLQNVDDFYLTRAIGDHAIASLEEHARNHKGNPFFQYLAFTAPHFPIQAPADLIAKYRQRYRAGWDAVRQARYQRLRESGMITGTLSAREEEIGPRYQPSPETLALLGPGEVNRPLPWQSLTPQQQAFQTEKMAIYAAMVEALDREVGRVIEQIRAMGAWDNTLILFASDNGSSSEIMVRGGGHDPTAAPGSAQSFLCLGPGWSTAANTPFRRHKVWAHEGGIATPWIVHWPAGIQARGELRQQPVHLVDVTPTVLELAGVVPPRELAGRAVPPMQGRSFAALLNDPAAAPPQETLWWCHEGHRAVREGDWKLVSDPGKPWELYNLASDRSETVDLAKQESARVADLEAQWLKTAAACRELAADESPVSTAAPVSRPSRPPNVVILFADDLGYGDPGCYGGRAAATPNIDRLAREGVRFTDFYVAQPVCSASRAALLTGCYPNRLSIQGALMPEDRHGLSAAETTLAELLRSRGYRTAAVGKWHLGHRPPFLPTRQGFDSYFGLPYSNDMWPFHPETHPGHFPDLPLLDGERVINPAMTPADQAKLTAAYTQRAVSFVEASARDEQPFFLYLAHSMPHVPLFAGEAFQGKSPGGLYGDVLSEIDASLGAVLAALERTGHADDTLVIFSSDNGPWLSYGNHAGSAGNLREGKGTVFEGGVRVPCVARLSGVIPAGQVCREPAMTIDLLPTLASLTGEALPEDSTGHCLVEGRPIDGHDITPLFTGLPTAGPSPERAYGFWYLDNQLQGVRRGRWKLLLPHTARTMAGQAPGADGRPGTYAPLEVKKSLYDLVADPGERQEISAAHPEVVAQLEQVAEEFRAELGDTLTQTRGSAVRPADRLPDEAPPVSGKKPKRSPNIIYVMTDDQGYGDLSAHGNPVLRTPHLDRLHSQSVRFTEFHASPTCAPTRSALLTGRHEFRSGVTHTIHERERLALSATTLPQRLSSAGYSSGIFGKWHLGDEDAYQPLQRGFDRAFIHGAGGIGQSFPGSCGDVPDNSYFDPWVRSDGIFQKTQGYCTDVFFTAALAWIDQCRQTDRPFFCMITPNAPHGPLDCPPGSDQQYLEPLAAAGIADPQERGNIAKFYGMIRNIDDNVGRLLERLEAWGLAENTLVVFTTDNGTATGEAVFNDQMRGKKGTPWRGGTRVPSLWRLPGEFPAGVDVSAVTAHIDVLPTLCELAGVGLPAEALVEGRSLVPLLRDKHAPWPTRSLYTHVGRWGRGEAAQAKWANCRVRRDQWSLVNVQNREAGWELYDIASDPGETRNVAADHPQIVAQLSGDYDTWWQQLQPDLVNENLDGPAENPFKTAFQRQTGEEKTSPAGKRKKKSEAATAVQLPPPTLVDVPYGLHPKQVLHFWKAAGATAEHPSPLLFFIHGGGWNAGDRNSVGDLLPALLAHGISVVSIEYRFIAEAMAAGIDPPVKAPLFDAARALQMVRSHAAEWHIDPTRVIASGASAGACSSLWLAFHDDMADPTSTDPVARQSTRLLAAAVTIAQTTLDPAQMLEWTPNSRYGGHAFGFFRDPNERDSQFAEFLAARDRLLPVINQFSPYALVTADDPPVQLVYRRPPALGQPEKDPTHTANFGVKLQERLAAVGVPCELVYPGAPDVRHTNVAEYVVDTLQGK